MTRRSDPLPSSSRKEFHSPRAEALIRSGGRGNGTSGGNGFRLIPRDKKNRMIFWDIIILVVFVGIFFPLTQKISAEKHLKTGSFFLKSFIFENSLYITVLGRKRNPNTPSLPLVITLKTRLRRSGFRRTASSPDLASASVRLSGRLPAGGRGEKAFNYSLPLRRLSLRPPYPPRSSLRIEARVRIQGHKPFMLRQSLLLSGPSGSSS